MSLSTLGNSALGSAGKSLLAVAAINLIFELKSIRYDREKKRWTIGNDITAKQRLKDALRQFGFIFGQIVSFNAVLSLNSKRLTFPLGCGLAYLFTEFFDMKLPLLVSAYITAKVGALFLEKAAKMGIIKNEMLIYKVLFVLLMGAMNIYMFAFPTMMPRRVYKNYMKIGRLTEVDRLQFDLIAEKRLAIPPQV